MGVGEVPRQYCRKQRRNGLGTALTESIALPLPLFARKTSVPLRSRMTSNWRSLTSSSLSFLGSWAAVSR